VGGLLKLQNNQKRTHFLEGGEDVSERVQRMGRSGFKGTSGAPLENASGQWDKFGQGKRGR